MNKLLSDMRSEMRDYFDAKRDALHAQERAFEIFLDFMSAADSDVIVDGAPVETIAKNDDGTRVVIPPPMVPEVPGVPDVVPIVRDENGVPIEDASPVILP